MSLSPADFISLTDFNPALSTFNAQPLYSYQQAALEKKVNINRTQTQLASSSVNSEALVASELCNNHSSDSDSDSDSETDEEDRAKKILAAYSKKLKVRRIKPRSPNSATMYGRLRSKKNKRERFCADSGTGVPIIPKEIVEDHEIPWEQVDPDEPGCESAS